MQELDLGFQIPNASVDAFAAGSITSANFLRNSNHGANHYANWIIHRPTAASAADYVRYAGALTNSSGLLAHTGANYSDTTVGTETVELWKPLGIRPDTDVLNAFNRALEMLTFQAWEPLSLAADAAMRESSATASWGTAVQCTPTKTTTAARVYPGFIRALTITGDGANANGYQPTANIAVSPNEQIVVAALCRTHSGTGCRLVFRDVTGSASDSTVITHSGSDYKLMLHTFTTPASCVNINIRIGGQGVSDVTDWQALWVLRPQAPTPMRLPDSYIDERYKLEALATSHFGHGTADSNVYEGMSLAIVEASQDAYSFNVMPPAANPAFIQFHDKDLINGTCLPWLQLRLPYSEQGAISTETGTTTAPAHLVIAATKVELLKPVALRERIPNGQKMYDEALKVLADESRLRTVEGPAMKRETFSLSQYRN